MQKNRCQHKNCQNRITLYRKNNASSLIGMVFKSARVPKEMIIVSGAQKMIDDAMRRGDAATTFRGKSEAVGDIMIGLNTALDAIAKLKRNGDTKGTSCQ